MQPETNRLITGFILCKQAEGCSPNTIADYQNNLNRLLRWCGANNTGDLDTISSIHFQAFFAQLRQESNGRGKPLSPKTIRNCWVCLRSFYRWLAAESSIVNPMLSVPAPKTSEAVIEPLSHEEIAAILKACDTTRIASPGNRQSFTMKRDTARRDRSIVLTLLDSGLRASELCALTISDVDLASGKILVRSGKGGKGRITYIGKNARKALWRYLSARTKPKGDEPLFLTRDERPLTSDRLAHLFCSIGERAGVAKLHPHRLRHSFATEFLRNGGNVLGLQRLLGHSSLEMVRRYAAVADADLAKAHETSSPADKWKL